MESPDNDDQTPEVSSEPDSTNCWWHRPLSPRAYGGGVVLLTTTGLLVSVLVGLLMHWLLPFRGSGGVTVWCGVLYFVALVGAMIAGPRIALSAFGVMLIGSGVVFAHKIHANNITHVHGLYATLLYVATLIAAAMFAGAVLPPLRGWTRNLRKQWWPVLLMFVVYFVISGALTGGLGVANDTFVDYVTFFTVVLAINAGNDIRYTKHDVEHVVLSGVSLTVVFDMIFYIALTRY